MGLSKITNQVVSSCPTCLLNNPQVSTKPSLVQPPQHKGSYPREDWKVDFTYLGTHYTLFQGHKYLLVFVDTFIGWIEAFPILIEKVQEIARKLLHEIFPGSGHPTHSRVVMGQPSLPLQFKQSSRPQEQIMTSNVLGIPIIGTGRKSQFLKSAIRKITQKTSPWKEAPYSGLEQPPRLG